MRTVLDMDEGVLALAKQKASEEGKSLDAIVEEGLRVAFQMKGPNKIPEIPPEGELLEENDPFFLALKEVRNAGRVFGRNRGIELNE